MVEFQSNRRMFVARNDMVKRWLGAKPGSGGLFVIISGKESACLEFLEISGLLQKGQGFIHKYLCMVEGLIP